MKDLRSARSIILFDQLLFGLAMTMLGGMRWPKNYIYIIYSIIVSTLLSMRAMSDARFIKITVYIIVLLYK